MFTAFHPQTERTYFISRTVVGKLLGLSTRTREYVVINIIDLLQKYNVITSSIYEDSSNILRPFPISYQSILLCAIPGHISEDSCD